MMGLIPARAGKTASIAMFVRRRWAHPRAGGENAIVIGMVREGMGSSPRGRGKRLLRRGHRLDGRLIPARAGKTVDSDSSAGTRWAHPRAGGEN